MKTKNKICPSVRIEFMADFIKHPVKFVDIGCDHGFVCISLAMNPSSKKIVAVDISNKCLEKAKENARRYGVADTIQFVQSDGFDNITGSFDACLIAGIGGEEIVKIIHNKPNSIKIKNFYLQPATKVVYLKRWLVNHGYKIVLDQIVMDKNKFYNCLKVKKGKQRIKDFELYFGKDNLKKPSEDFKAFIEVNYNKLSKYDKNKISDNLQKELDLFANAYRRIKK